MAVYTGTSRGDLLLGGFGDDTLIGLGGNDTLIDLIGNNTFDAGGGSDLVTGGIGNDIFIHRIAENVGFTDRYDGGLGQDTLRLVLTSQEWARADVQADVAAFLAYQTKCINKLLNPIGFSLPFTFKSTNLTVINIENLQVTVEGVAIDPHNHAVVANADTLAITEDTVGASIDLLANDSVPDRAASVTLLSSGTYGTAMLTPSLNGATQTAVLTYTPSAAVQSLKAGQVVTDTISYKVIDVNGDSSTSTVTVKITGVNDAATITGPAAGKVTEDGTLSAIGKLTVSDVDTGENQAVAQTGTAGVYGSFSIETTGAWSYALNNTSAKVQALAQGQTATDSFIVKSLDGTASQVVTITVTGSNDAPVLAADASGPHTITEAVGTGNTTIDKSMGSLSFTDVDLTDTHTVGQSAPTFSWSAGTLSALQISALTTASTLALSNTDSTSTGSGSVGFTYSAADSAFDFLAASEKLTVVYNVTVTDSSSVVSTKPITITVTGTNDAPVIATADKAESGSIFEQGFTTGSTAIDQTSGIIHFADADFSDRPTASIGTQTVTAVLRDGVTMLSLTSAQIATLKAAFQIAAESGNINKGAIDWTYKIADGALDFLPQSAVVAVISQVVVADGVHASDTNTVTVKLMGANDLPLVATADVTQSASMAEQSNVMNSAGYDQTGGVIHFSDADYGDRPTASVGTQTITAYLADGTTPLSLTSAQIATLKSAFQIAAESGNTNSGAIDWTYKIGDAALDFLPQNAVVKVASQVMMNDSFGGGGGAAGTTSTVTVTITGSNDAPVLAADTSGPHAISEVSATTGNTQLDTATGSLSFTDVDLTDSHSASQGAPSFTWSGGTLNASQLAALTSASTLALAKTEPTSTAAGSVGFTYSAVDKTFDFLAQGQTLTVVYNVTVTDTNGAPSTRPVTIVVKGSNDISVIADDTSGPHTIMEAAGTGNATIDIAKGSLSFTDADISDRHVASSTGQAFTWSGGTLSNSQIGNLFSPNALQLTVTEQTATAAGSVGFTYSAPDQNFDFLAAGETLTIGYNIQVNDFNAVAQKPIAITVVGTNDTPIVTSGNFSGSVTEDTDLKIVYTNPSSPGSGKTGPQQQQTVLHSEGVIAFSDADFNDTHIITVLPSKGNSGSLIATLDNDTTGGVSGSLDWAYTLNNASVQALAQNETVTEKFNISIDDGHGGRILQAVTITVNGTNDAPVVSGVVSGVAIEDGAKVSLDALAYASDVDHGAVLSVVAPSTLPAGVTYNAATHSFTLDPSNAAYQSLANGEQATVNVNYGVTDGMATTAATASWTVTGTNDDAVITAPPKLDIIVSNSSGPGAEIILGHGDGTFQPAQTTEIGAGNRSSVAVADLNGDGKPDLIVAAQGGPQVSLGNGDGTFQDSQPISDGSFSASALAVADINGDGKLDIVAVTGGGVTRVSLGIGDGTFQAVYPVNTGTPGENIVLADVNGDGKLDIIEGSGIDEGIGAYVSLGNGDGTFQSGQAVSTGGITYQVVAVADFNGDGKPDIIVTNQDTGARISFGNGDGTFQPGQAVAIGGDPAQAIVVADVNGDGRPDIVALSFYGGAQVSLGNGDGTFQAATTVNTGGSYHQAVAVGDVNGDGKPDIIVSSSDGSGVQVSFGNGDGTFQNGFSIPAGRESHRANSLVVAEVNTGGTGYLTEDAATSVSDKLLFTDVDLNDKHTVSTSYTGSGTTIGSLIADVTTDTKGTGTGGVITWTYTPDPTAIQSLAAGEHRTETFDVALSDGTSTVHKAVSITLTGTNDDAVITAAAPRPSIVVGSSDRISLAIGDSQGNFATTTFAATGVDGRGIAVADMNGDGTPDIVAATRDGLQVKIGNSDGTFGPGLQSVGQTGDHRDIAVADLNGDGKLDVIETNFDGSDGAQVFLGNGDGTLAFQGLVDTEGDSRRSIAVGDVNGDGILDLVVTNESSSSVAQVSLGQGGGTFATGTAVLGSGQPRYAVALADVDHDGKLDLILATSAGATVSLGSGTGTFGAPIPVTDGNQQAEHLGLAVIDVNHDGNLDLVVSNISGSAGAQVSLGNGDGTFSRWQAVNTGGDNHYAIDVGDLNGDGNVDIAVTNFDASDVSVSFGDGTGQFATGIPLTTGGNTHLVNSIVIAKVNTPSDTGYVSEGGATTTSDKLLFSDADLKDVHHVSTSYTGSGTPIGSLTADVTTDTTNTGKGGVITWTFTANADAFSSFGPNEARMQTFDVALNDGSSTIHQEIDVTLTANGSHVASSTPTAPTSGPTVVATAGPDSFVFQQPTDQALTITGFQSGTDSLQISAANFGHGLAAHSMPALVLAADPASATHAGTGGYFIFENTGPNAGTVLWDATGGSGADATVIAHLTGVTSLLASDFHLV